jgi:hypothetical protein
MTMIKAIANSLLLLAFYTFISIRACVTGIYELLLFLYVLFTNRRLK